MRRLVLAGLFVLFALGAPPVAEAQSPTPAQIATIRAIMSQYPDGGPQLQQAIAAALEADPTLAAAVQVAQTANVAQQQGIGLGLAEAAAVLGSNGTAAGLAAAQQITQIAETGPAALSAVFTTATATMGSVGPGITGTSGLTTSNCISPSAPGNHC
jgi:hypothetical protein